MFFYHVPQVSPYIWKRNVNRTNTRTSYSCYNWREVSRCHYHGIIVSVSTTGSLIIRGVWWQIGRNGSCVGGWRSNINADLGVEMLPASRRRGRVDNTRDPGDSIWQLRSAISIQRPSPQWNGFYSDMKENYSLFSITTLMNYLDREYRWNKFLKHLEYISRYWYLLHLNYHVDRPMKHDAQKLSIDFHKIFRVHFQKFSQHLSCVSLVASKINEPAIPIA